MFYLFPTEQVINSIFSQFLVVSIVHTEGPIDSFIHSYSSLFFRHRYNAFFDYFQPYSDDRMGKCKQHKILYFHAYEKEK